MNTTELIAQVRADIAARKAMPDFGPETSIERIKTINATQRSFTPKTVEALVEALESARGEIEYLREQTERTDELEAQRKLAFMACNRWADKCRDAEKRIAELEAREVREEGNQFLIVRYPGKAPVIKHGAGNLEGFLRQLLEHEPMATIDIVTHRYYGIGGQWVKDADEYLHMMDAERKSKEVKGE